jgi:hypothetical protein
MAGWADVANWDDQNWKDFGRFVRTRRVRNKPPEPYTQEQVREKLNAGFRGHEPIMVV